MKTLFKNKGQEPFTSMEICPFQKRFSGKQLLGVKMILILVNLLKEGQSWTEMSMSKNCHKSMTKLWSHFKLKVTPKKKVIEVYVSEFFYKQYFK